MRYRWVYLLLSGAVLLASSGSESSLALAESAGSLIPQGSGLVAVSEPVEEAGLSFAEGGVVESVGVQEGDFVEEGEVLATLESATLAVALRLAKTRAASEAGETQAKAERDLRQRRRDEMRRISEKGGGVTEDELLRAEADLEISEAQLEQAELARQEAVLQVEQIEAQLARRRLRSPFSGVVERLYRSPGEAVTTASEVVLRLVRLDALDLVLYVPAKEQGRFREEGQWRVHALDDPSLDGVATVVFVSPITDASSGTTRVPLRLENAEGRHRAGIKYALEPSVEDP